MKWDVRKRKPSCCSSYTELGIMCITVAKSQWTLFGVSNFSGNKHNQSSELKPKRQLIVANGGFWRRMLFCEFRFRSLFFVFLRLGALLPLQVRSQRQRRSSGSPRSHPFSLLKRRHFRQGNLRFPIFASSKI